MQCDHVFSENLTHIFSSNAKLDLVKCLQNKDLYEYQGKTEMFHQQSEILFNITKCRKHVVQQITLAIFYNCRTIFQRFIHFQATDHDYPPPRLYPILKHLSRSRSCACKHVQMHKLLENLGNHGTRFVEIDPVAMILILTETCIIILRNIELLPYKTKLKNKKPIGFLSFGISLYVTGIKMSSQNKIKDKEKSSRTPMGSTQV